MLTEVYNRAKEVVHSFNRLTMDRKCFGKYDQHPYTSKIYSCDECQLVFKLKRQLTKHIVKKHSIERKCNWCGIEFFTSPKQAYYCTTCKEGCFRECKRCHRPLPDKKYFKLDDKRCNACQRKYNKEKQNGKFDSWFGQI